MSRDLGTPDAPTATRAVPPGWRDPRLWLGVAIVAVSVVVGARVVAAADDSVEVWAVAADLGAGDAVAADDLVPQRVRFEEPGRLDTYFAVDESLPADLVLRRAVGAGELLARTAVGPADPDQALHLPVAVDAALVPPSVGAGSVVDVYLTGAGADRAAARPGRAVLAAVTVVDAPRLDEGFVETGRRQLVLGVDEAAASRFFRLVGALEAPVLTVVRRS